MCDILLLPNPKPETSHGLQDSASKHHAGNGAPVGFSPMAHHPMECGKKLWLPHTHTFRGEGDSPAKKNHSENSSTEPTGKLTGSIQQPQHHEMKTTHFKGYSFLMEGVLKLRMVSTTLVERPRFRSWSTSGAKPTVSTSPGRGEGLSPLPRKEGPF